MTAGAADSGRRLEIGRADVERLVADQLPQWAGLPVTGVEVAGWDNHTFRLGRELSVRVPSSAEYTAQVEAEHRWLPILAPHIPLPIPVPIVKGRPGDGCPWAWSVYRWIDGETADPGRIGDPVAFATALGGFLAALERIDPTDGPVPGPRNFFRGGPLSTYDTDTRNAIAALGDRIPCELATGVWESALAATRPVEPVWFHGDVAAGNLLVRAGRLSAVIDFGCLGVGDPACDLVIAWTLLSGAGRTAFRSALAGAPAVDRATWARGRGWALWKALITLADSAADGADPAAAAAGRTLDEVLADDVTGTAAAS